MFITLEGLDGCGKSTQAALLADALIAQGHRVTLTRNPGDTALGRELRQTLLHTTAPVHPRAEMLLYVADRTQHWFEQLLPRLQAGEIVLCDRYIDSTIAYQGYGREESVNWILDLHQQALDNPYRCYWPDITLWFDAPVDVCLGRVQRRQPAGDRLEQENIAFYTRVRQGFAAQAEAYPDRFVTLDAQLPIDQLAAMCQQRVQLSLQTISL